MSSKKKKTKKKPNKYRLELTFKSVIFWVSGMFFLLVWIFILGVLVGQGHLSFGIMKDKFIQAQDMVSEEGSKDLDPAKKPEEDPKFAFYGELSSKKEAASKKNHASVRTKSTTEKTYIQSDKKPNNTLSNIQKGVQRYVLQIGSFKDKAKAMTLVDRLNDRDYPAFYSGANINGNSYYRVTCGPFKTEKNADEFKKNLAKKEDIHGFVTRAGK